MNEGAATRKGLIYGVAAYGSWGLLPIFWKLLKHVPALEILSHRILWSAVTAALILFLTGGFGRLVRSLSNRRTALLILGSMCMIACNWLIFIWAVNVGQVLEVSLGYFLNPLLTVALGVLLLGERLNPSRRIALLLVSAAVLVLALGYGRIPWVGLSLALTFAFYGLLRKSASGIGPTDGLAAETMPLAVPSILFLLYLGWENQGAFGVDVGVGFWLVASGPLTFLPLLFFAQGIRRLPLSTMGFLQYLAPSLHFVQAVFLFREPFTGTHLLVFALIWTALAVLSWDVLRRAGRRRIAS